MNRYYEKKKLILLIGGTGQLGSAIVKSKLLSNIFAPSKKKLNLLNTVQIRKFCKKNFSIIINCAGFPRIRECEKNKNKSFKLNVATTKNLVREIILQNKKRQKKIKLVQISSDAVYNSTRGNYKESDICNPKTYYGYCKYLTEKFVRKIPNHLIIRTRFFDKRNFKYKDAATNIYSSMVEVNKLIKYIKVLINKDVCGVINVGERKNSDYNKLKKYIKNIKKTTRDTIQKNTETFITKDSSMNLNKLKKILK